MGDMKTDVDSPYPVRVEKRDDGWYVICSATVVAPEGADLSDVERQVEAEAIRASHIAAADIARLG